MNKLIAESYSDFLNEAITFKELSDKELVDLKQGELEDFNTDKVSAYYWTSKDNWNFAIYLNSKGQYLVWGNPIKGQGEVFRIEKGGKKEATEEVKELK